MATWDTYPGSLPTIISNSANSVSANRRLGLVNTSKFKGDTLRRCLSYPFFQDDRQLVNGEFSQLGVTFVDHSLIRWKTTHFQQTSSTDVSSLSPPSPEVGNPNTPESNENIQNIYTIANIQNIYNIQSVHNIHNIQSIDTIQNIHNIENIHNIHNIENIANIQNIENNESAPNIQNINIENVQNIDNIENVDVTQDIQKNILMTQIIDMENVQINQNIDIDNVHNIENIENVENTGNVNNVQNVDAIENVHHIDNIQNAQNVQNTGENENADNVDNAEDMEDLSGYMNDISGDSDEGFDDYDSYYDANTRTPTDDDTDEGDCICKAFGRWVRRSIDRLFSPHIRFLRLAMRAENMPYTIIVLFACLVVAFTQTRYYSLDDMPETSFDCRDKILGGYYADPEANCQMFHVCVKIPGKGVQDFKFLCPNHTVFDQENHICVDSGDIDCEASGLYLENFDLYRIGSPQAKTNAEKKTPTSKNAIPFGPSVKTPLISDNNYEDDEYYLQRSVSGDRKSGNKEIFRGSSSSNFFNNRNKGKEPEDDYEESSPVNREQNTNNQFKSRANIQPRPKTQFQSQFTGAPATNPPSGAYQNALNEKKRTKVAVRKLERRPVGGPVRDTTQSNVPSSTLTTRVTNKYGFGDQNTKYNTVNRQQTTPSTFSTIAVQKQQTELTQPQQQQQQRVQNFRRTEQQTTLAFFEPSPTSETLPKAVEIKTEGNKDNSDFSLLRNPIVAAGPSFQGANKNRGTNNFAQSRPTTAFPSNQPFSQTYTTAPVNGNFPSPTPNGIRNPPTQQNYQDGNQNFQQSRPTTVADGSTFPRQRQNFFYEQSSTEPKNIQQNRQQPPVNNGNYRSQQVANENFNNGQQNRQTVQQQQQQQQNRQYYNRNDDFDEGDNQEFLKTAPSNNFRPSDLNSFNKNNFKTEDKTAPTTFTPKYYTPTIITTPRVNPSFDSRNNARQTSKNPEPTTLQPSTSYRTTPAYDSRTNQKQQSQGFSTQYPTNSPSNYYKSTVTTTARPQRIYPSPTPVKPVETKDASYDYAYYDDAGSFSEYDSIDSLGESDFARTSQRAKSRLI